MKNKEKSYKMKTILAYLCTLILVISILSIAVGTSFADEDLAESKVVMATWTGNSDFTSWEKHGYEVIEEYGDSVLAEIEKGDLMASHPNIVNNAINFETEIETNTMNFDPVEKNSLANNNDELYIIQFNGPIKQDWIRTLERQGAELIHYIPNNAFLVEYENDLSNLNSESFTRAITPYPREMRVNPEVYEIEGDIADILVLVRSNSLTRTRLDSLSESKIHLFSIGDEVVYDIEIDRDMVSILNKMPGLIWAEPSHDIELHGEVGTEIVGGSYVGDGAEVTRHGYTGDEVTVSIADTGVDTGEKETMHPDLRGRVEEFYYYEGTEHPGDGLGHGTHVAGIAAGDASTGIEDEDGYLYGHGTAPETEIVSQKIFDDAGAANIPELDKLASDAAESDVQIHSNSWGAPVGGAYDLLAAAFDHYTRDANVFTEEEEQMLFVTSAGNSGPLKGSIGSPATAKNVITVGASENYRPNVGGNFADNPDEIARFSSRGPTRDGRIKPDIVAPGTYVSSALSSLSQPGWAHGSPDGEYYEFVSGTSMSAPYVAGGAAVFTQFYQDTYQSQPSPALVRAALINGAVDLEGAEDSTPIPNMDEGWGRMDLTNTLISDEGIRFYDQMRGLQTGEAYGETVTVTNPEEPLKITMTYSDVPGSPDAERALVNNLNLQVIGPDGQSYHGNAFSDGWSDPSIEEVDDVNNVQNVYVEEPQEGEYQVVVYGASVPEDAVAETGDIEQDFALVTRGGIDEPSVGRIMMDEEQYSTEDTVEIEIFDSILNTDSSKLEEVTIKVSSDYPDGENVVLEQEHPDSSSFVGSLELTEEGREFDDGKLQVEHGSEITGIYLDNSPYGERRTTAEVIGEPPNIKEVEVVRTTSDTAEIEWTTDTETTASIYWREEDSEDWNEKYVDMEVEEHELTIDGLTPNTAYEFYLESVNVVGLQTIDDNEGNYYSFDTGDLPEILLVYRGDYDYLSDTLIEIDRGFDIWDYTDDGIPSSHHMRAYDAVIWSTEDEYDGLSHEAHEELSEYLDHNGKLYLSSQNYPSYTGETTFAQEYLHVSEFDTHWDDAENVTGIEGDPITDGMGPWELTYPGWVSNADYVYPSEDGSEIFLDQDDEPVALRTNDTDLPYRTVFTSFPFEALAEEDSENAEEFLDSVLDWLIVEYETDVSIRDLEFSQPWTEPGDTIEVTTTVSNDGTTEMDATYAVVRVDGEVVSTKVIDPIPTGDIEQLSFEITPETIGELEVKVEIAPLEGEVETEDNKMSDILYCRDPVKTVDVAVLRSFGSDAAIHGMDMMWDEISEKWWKYGNQNIEIDYESLHIENIEYEDIEETGADVLYISHAYSEIGYQYDDNEINAIKDYVASGRGIIASGGTLGQSELEEELAQNMKLAPMFGINESVPGEWDDFVDLDDPMEIKDLEHPIFEGLGDEYRTGNPSVTVDHVIEDGNVKAEGIIPGGFIGPDRYAYLVEHKYGGGNTLYFPNWPEFIEANHQDKTLLYNSLVWSSENSTAFENQVSIQTVDKNPEWGEPDEPLDIDAVVRNLGTADQTDLNVTMYADNEIVDDMVIQEIKAGGAEQVTLSWTPEVKDDYDISIEVEPVEGETFTENNELEFKYRVFEYGGHINVAVLDGYGTYFVEPREKFENIEENWYKFGNYSIEFDYTTLSSLDEHFAGEELPRISYEDLSEAKAEVLYMPGRARIAGYEFNDEWTLTDSEISALENFTKDGSAFVWTSGFWYEHWRGISTENNKNIMPLFGLDPETQTEPVHIDIDQPIFDLNYPDHSAFEELEDPYQPGSYTYKLYDGTVFETDGPEAYTANVTDANVLAEPYDGVDDYVWITERKAGMGQTVYSSFDPVKNGYYEHRDPDHRDFQFLYNLLTHSYENTSYSPRISHEERESIGLEMPLEVTSEIYHFDGEIEEATLYYNGSTDESFTEVSMDRVEDDSWSAEIPPQSEIGDGEIQYYIKAESVDGTVVRSPIDDNFVTVIDVEPPIIEHSPKEETYIGQPTMIEAEVIDEYGVTNVAIEYTDVNGNLQEVKMSKLAGNNYSGIIPSQEDIGVIDYQIIATDVNENEQITEEQELEVKGHLLRVNVVDSNGTPVRYASGELENEQTGESRRFQTDASGMYDLSLSLLSDGYSIGDTITVESMYDDMKTSSSIDIDEDGIINLEVVLDFTIIGGIETVSISPEGDQVVEAGETIDLSAEAYDEYGNLIEEDDTVFDWENTDETGLFEETEVGKYAVTATHEGVTSEPTIVTVEPADVEYVLIDPDEDQTIETGETIDFSAEAYDEYDNLISDVATDFTWENTDDSGIFDEIEAGKYSVTASYEDVTSETIIVTVLAEHFEVEITEADEEIEEDDTLTVEFEVENSGDIEGTQEIVFSVDDEEVDMVEMTIGIGEIEEGEFTWNAEDAGEFDLEVASDDTSDLITVTVEEEEDRFLDIPGFTTMLLILGVVIAIAIYHKKEK